MLPVCNCWLESFTLLFIFSATFLQGGDSAGIFGTLGNLIEIGHRAYKDFCKEIPPSAYMSSPELISSHGYPVEEHKITTDDGFILTVHSGFPEITHCAVYRIPYGKRTRVGTKKKEPVLLYHGFISSSDDWLLQPEPENNLPYLLANDGHDVWLGNNRGNSYSRDPTTHGLTVEDKKYYDFGFDELSQKDFPAVIQYILKVTKAPKLSYVGHSLGGSLFAFGVSFQPKFNQLIRKSSLLAPGIVFEHSTSPVFRPLLNDIPAEISEAFANAFAGGKSLPTEINALLKKYAPIVCVSGKLGQEVCDNIIFIIAGYNRGQMTNITSSRVSGHTPSDSPIKILGHAHQMVKAKRNQMYDYGPLENLELYGSLQPPMYNVTTIKVPVQGLYGLNDLLVSPEDAVKGFNRLGNLAEMIEVQNRNWSHLDFMYGKDARSLVYDNVVRFLGS